MQVVINNCYGGFGLSPKAIQWLYENGLKEIAVEAETYYGINIKLTKKNKEHRISNLSKDIEAFKEYQKNPRSILFITVFSPDFKYVLSGGRMEEMRNDPLLIKCIKTLKKEANGSCADLKIVDIPDGTDWVIYDYDGMECVEEKHASWS